MVTSAVPIDLDFELMLVPGVLLPAADEREVELAVPRELATAYDLSSSRAPRRDFMEACFADPPRGGELAAELLEEAPDPRIAACLSPLFACELHLPPTIDAQRVSVEGAWFARGLARERFAPGQRMAASLLPAVRLHARFRLARAPAVPAAELVGRLQWRLRAELADALDGVAYALVAARARESPEGS